MAKYVLPTDEEIKKKKNNKKIIDDVNNTTSKFNELIKLIATNTNSISSEIEKDLDDSSRRLLSNFSSLLQTTNSLSNGDVVGSIQGMLSNDSGKSAIDIQQELTKNNERYLNELYSANKSNFQYNEDIRVLSSIISQLRNAIETVRDSILSPDNVAELSSLLIKCATDNVNGTDKEWIRTNILEKYDFENELIKTLDETLTYGKHHISVIPFSKAFKETTDNIIKNSDKLIESNILTECTEYIEEFKQETENETLIKSTTLNENLKTITEQFLPTIEICQGINSIDFCKNSQEKTLLESVVKFKGGTTSYSSITDVKTTTDGFNKINKNKKQSECDFSDIPGSIVKHYDINRILPIEVNSTTVAYIYIQTKEQSDKFKNTVNNPIMALNKINNRYVNMMAYSDKDKYLNSNDALCDTLTYSIMNKLSHYKPVIKDNKELKDKIFNILKGTEINKSKLKITFLDESEVIQFKTPNGLSMIHYSLFYARIYLALTVSTALFKINKSPDTTMYYVKSGVSKDSARAVNNAVSSLKTRHYSILNLNNVKSLLGNIGKGNEMIIPESDNGERPISFDIASGQDTSIRDEFIEFVEEKMVNSTRVPIPLLDSTTEVDFAKTLSMLNSKFLKLIISYQKVLHKPTNEFFSELLKFECNKDDVTDIVNSFSVAYQVPSGMALSLALDQINLAKDYASQVAGLMLGESYEDEDVVSELTYMIVKDYAPNVDFEKYEKYLEIAKINARKRKAEKGMTAEEETM